MSVAAIVSARGNSRENLLEILHEIQDRTPDHSLHEKDLAELSRLMEIPVADIVGTASFYTLFSLKPRGRHIIRLCESPPCYILGSDNVLEAIRNKLGIDFGHTTADGCFTLEETSCLGTCGVAPVMMVDDVVYGNLTAAKVGEILDEIRAGAPAR
jgi:NADH:ubiquinone oxidoreductase subunit E